MSAAHRRAEDRVVILFPIASIAAGLVVLVGLGYAVRRRPIPARLRAPFAISLAGLLGGLALGAGLRLAMRIAAMMGGGREVSVGGTVALVAGVAIFTAPLAFALAGLRRILPLGGRAAAVACGLALLALTSPFLLGEGELAERGALWVNRLTFGACSYGYGFATSVALDRMRARIGVARAGRSRSVPA